MDFGDFGLDGGGSSNQPPSFAHFFWFCVAAILIFVAVRQFLGW